MVVVGGGWGGATAAKYVRLQDPSIEVILLEPNRSFVSCPFSNLVLSGLETMSAITFTYDGLRAHGVKIRHETATAIEPDTKRVRIGEGYLEYDRLVVSPGVDFMWDQVDGVAGQESAVLHAWKAGPQTAELASRLQGLPDGGVVVMTVPPVAYRCPPGPYERACQIAWFLQTKKPRAKLVVLDANNDIVSKTALFKAVFRGYPNLEYRPTSKLERVDLAGREILPAIGDRVRYDVLNLIPPQRAGAIALGAGLGDANNRWCEVNHVTYESAKQPGVRCAYVVWFAVWVPANVGLFGIPAFDPFPFGLLTPIVSLEAIFLSTFVLVSQNRQAAIADSARNWTCRLICLLNTKLPGYLNCRTRSRNAWTSVKPIRRN